MINPPVPIALLTVLSLLGLWVLFFWLYRDYRVDLFRERTFALRDELFALGASGAISFDDPAYGMLRSMLNGYIRFAHRLSLLFVVIVFARKRGELNEATSRAQALMRAIDAHPPETRSRLIDILSRTHFNVFDQLVFTSASLWLALGTAVVFVITRSLGRSLQTRIMNWLRGSDLWKTIRARGINPMDSVALATGAAQ